jgi:zinc/manganese transport system permease protein
MNDLLAWLPIEPEHRFMWRAAMMCVLLGISSSLLGCVLMVRRLSLMGDALAHSMLPGVGIAWLIVGTSLPALLVGGLVAGLVTAIASGVISRLTRVKEDAAFAAFFIALMGLGVALVSRAGTPVDLLHFLFGNILAVNASDLYLAASVSSATIILFALFYRNILLECFDPAYHRACGGWSFATHLGLLALVVLNLVAALHAMGSVLALGLFMLPAVTAYLWCNRWGLMLGLAIIYAVSCSLLGLVLSWYAGLASGPSIVMTLGAGFLLSALLSPKHGLLSRFLRPEHHHQDNSDEYCETHPH